MKKNIEINCEACGKRTKRIVKEEWWKNLTEEDKLLVSHLCVECMHKYIRIYEKIFNK